MAAERTETGIPGGRSAKQPPLAVRAEIRGRLVRITALLSLAAIAFCLLVVWQRDTRMRNAALAWAENVREVLQTHLREHSTLPGKLPDALIADMKRFEMRYPNPDEITRLDGKPGPYVLVASPRKGLITPGGDGCAALIFDQGRMRIEWLTRPDIERERQVRRQLLGL